jgi:soluble lytic murein transglycosylase
MRIRRPNIRLLPAWASLAPAPAVWVAALGLALAGAPSAFAASKNEPAALPLVDVQAQWQSELPKVLSPVDAGLYKEIFSAQAANNWAAADHAMAKLKDRQLVGHVLAQRYLNIKAWHATYDELAAWLKTYADHPEAPAIYQMALRRAPKRHATALRRPTYENLRAGWFIEGDDNDGDNDSEAEMTQADQPDEGQGAEIADAPPPPGQKLVGEMLGRASGVKGQLQQRLRVGDLAGAEKLLRTRESNKLLSDGEYDYLKARVAAGWFAQGNDARALELASEAAARSGLIVPRANWIAGLSLYKQGKYEDAAKYFVALARTPNAQPWDLAAGAFWAGRAYLQARKPEVFNYWGLQAAQYPQTFYGMLAARTMSVEPAIDWDPPALSQSDIDSILRTSSGQRGFALIQAGEQNRASREFARLEPTGGPGLLRALLGVAMRANMPSLSIRLGRALSDTDGRRHDAALYPIPQWRPAGGFEVDPALVYAIMRQESAFNPRALSPAGARGLMQVMPATARLIDGRLKGNPEELYDPGVNMALGQKYVRALLDNDDVQGDLIRLAAAYNGGPGNLAKWKRKQDMRGDPGDDALLFIETVPSPETRAYITRVLYNYWIYSHRLGHPTPSLELLAAGGWPSYMPGEGEPGSSPVMVASAPAASTSAPAGEQTARAEPAQQPAQPTLVAAAPANLPPPQLVVVPVLPTTLDDLPAYSGPRSAAVRPAADGLLPLGGRPVYDDLDTTELAQAIITEPRSLALPMPPPARPVAMAAEPPPHQPAKARKKVRKASSYHATH